MTVCTICGTHTGTHWPNCPFSDNYDPSYEGRSESAATRLENAQDRLTRAETEKTLAQRKYDEALAAFKKEYNL